MFDVDIPQVAFSSNLVLNALYAISALDLFNRDPQDHAMEHASRFYFQKALVAHRKAIQDQVDDSHSVPVLFTAVLLVSVLKRADGHVSSMFVRLSAGKILIRFNRRIMPGFWHITH